MSLLDLESLKKQCEEGALMGFNGKQAIHPNQVEIIQKAFSPSPEKIEWAKELIKLFKDHQELEKGVLVYKNQSIDKPLIRQAENILKTAGIYEAELEIKARSSNQS